MPAWQGWLPWAIVSVTVILWTSFKVAAIGQQNIPWPGLHQAISITLYNDKPYGAIWTFSCSALERRSWWQRSSQRSS